MSVSKFAPSDPWNSKNVSLHGVPENQLLRNGIAPFVHIVFVFKASALSALREAVRWEFCCVPKYDGVEKVQILKWHCLTKNSARIQTPYPKLMIMVSFCWKMNFPHNEIKINSVLLMMSLKLTIKVIAFFLGHPAYKGIFLKLWSKGITHFLIIFFIFQQLKSQIS